MSTYKRLQQILAADYPLLPEQLAPQARLEDIGIDSLGVMELLFQIEDAFQIQVPSHQVSLLTVQDVVNYIDELLEAQKTGSHQNDSAAAPREP
ncbi:acyl carrier protein [Paralcaligenes ureilyticus]|uniref:Acyl carrier protein n=1 Tax=Paralcaligenes ureilyticus TaxID=627131 RepID=A0A4R3M9T0_9BURK|nr:acyl carrier protein [Paralcaligenes ureilyticus]TCT10200.1 acyl carrier protein [Paralcaligenes ureilyticus]